MNNMFWTGINLDGKFFVKPTSIPKNRDDALATIEALEMYYEMYPNLYLDLQNAKEYFETLEKLLKD